MFGTRRGLEEIVLSFELSFFRWGVRCSVDIGMVLSILEEVEGAGGESRGQHRREKLAVPSLGYCRLCYSNSTRKHRLALTL